jgi:hypothetical protein
MVPEGGAAGTQFGSNLGQPDCGLDGLDLTEEGAQALEFMMPSVVKQPGGFGRDLPLGRVRQFPPGIYILADFIDNRRSDVFLLRRG